MTVRRKINKSQAPLVSADDFIAGIDPRKTDENKINLKKNILLRIPSSLNESIDRIINERDIPITKHQWIVEAIAEKTVREK